MYRQVNPAVKKCCPQCDNLGFKRVADQWSHGTVLRCNSCHHEWERKGSTNISDSRSIIRIVRVDYDEN